MLNEHVAPAVFVCVQKRMGRYVKKKNAVRPGTDDAGSEQQSVLGNIIQP